MRVHEKASSEKEGRREAHRGEEEPRQGQEAGGEGSPRGSGEGGPCGSGEGRALQPGAPQGRRVATVPLPAAVGPGARRRRAPLLRLLGFLLGLLIAAAPVPAGADDRPVRLVT